MAVLGASLMAHQSRAHLVPELLDRTGIPAELVSWDRRSDRWDTGRRAFEMGIDSGTTHWMVLQDDAVVCRDLIPGLQVALDHVPTDAIACPYVGTRRPLTEKVTAAVNQADAVNASWIVLQTLNWGVAIIVPTATIGDMLTWCDKLTIPNYDKRVGQYYWRVHNWPCWYTHPSLVDHRDVPSLAGHGPDRRAHRFAGEDVSALDLPWDGERVMAIDWLTRGRRKNSRIREGQPMVKFSRVRDSGGRHLIVPVGSDRDRRLTGRPAQWIREELTHAAV